METIAKRAKQLTLSGPGEHVLTQYERRLRIEEDLTNATIRNYLSDLRHFAAWLAYDSELAKPSQDTAPLFLSEKRQTHLTERGFGYLIKKYAARADLRDVSPHDRRHRSGYRTAASVPLGVTRLEQVKYTLRQEIWLQAVAFVARKKKSGLPESVGIHQHPSNSSDEAA